MKRIVVILIVILGAFSLSSCQSPGTVGGAIVGGVVGSAFGGGVGKTMATIGGALVGGYLGNRLIDKPRQDYYYNRYKRRYN